MESSGGIVVIDAGTTHSKAFLFTRSGDPVRSVKTASARLSGAAYRAIDPEPLIAFARDAIAEFSAAIPVDDIVCCAHGSGLALLDADGALALPIMMYEADPPVAIQTAYEPMAPDFSEVFAPTNPMALTVTRQLLWQEAAFPEAFARVCKIVPWGQYVAYRLGAEPVCEVTALGAQTHLWDVRGNRYSSVVRDRGWAPLFAPLRRAWDIIGTFDPGPGALPANGLGRLRAGVHDSNANYLLYRAAGLDRFTLLSTGTWIIGFDGAIDLDTLNPDHDLVTNTDVFGDPVACCRFMGGREFECIAGKADPGPDPLAAAQRLIADGVLALPSFTESGGPLPGTGGKGRIKTSRPLDAADRFALAGLYTALMTNLSLTALGSTSPVVVDGPFAQNPLFLGTLAALRPGQSVLASTLADGTAHGAALLARFEKDRLPATDLGLAAVGPIDIPGLAAYAADWRNAVP